ncbi:hypothetical protein G9A89_014580 [Geosiphon pyriformis]|nr:hypothetical protein G9A89_014580 [Geosiphon pyriformis]
MFSNKFSLASKFLDLDAMWDIIRKIMVLLADGTFKKKWFKGFDDVFTKVSSRFYKLELLVSKLVKASCSVSSDDFVFLLKVWDRLNSTGALAVKSFLLLGSNFDVIHSALAKARKLYHFSKLLESKCTKESSIKQAINKRIKSFELDKGHIIKSVLEHPFRKVVLDHLVVGNELILEPDLVKPKVDEIMEGWTKKCKVVSNISDDWVCQYQPLDYVFNGAFSGKQHSNNKFKVATTPDTTTLEYYQSIYTHCKQRFNIPDRIEVVKKSVYQYIENRINNYLFENYNISEVRNNLYNNLAHYSQLRTEDLNSETLATYFHELNFNIIKYCEETYPVQSQYTIDFESETKTSNKGKNKLKQYSRTTPNTLTLLKTTAKHLQTPEQGTSSKLPLTITSFPASLAQAQTSNSPLNRFARPKDFTSLRSPTRQQEPLQTSSNLLDFLAENQSEHSETAANKENNFEIIEEESIDSGNEEDKMTTYIAKIPEFNGEDIETSPQEWLDQVTKAGDANGWNAARMLRTIPYFLKGTAGEWFENLAIPFNNWNTFKAAFLEQFTDNNTSITLRNHF